MKLSAVKEDIKVYLFILFLVVMVVAGADWDYHNGYDNGYEDAESYFRDYFQEVEENSYDNGYESGYEWGASDGYDEGYDEGYEWGFDVGNGEGYSEGYDEGYNQGYADAVMGREYDIYSTWGFVLVPDGSNVYHNRGCPLLAEDTVGSHYWIEKAVVLGYQYCPECIGK